MVKGHQTHEVEKIADLPHAITFLEGECNYFPNCTLIINVLTIVFRTNQNTNSQYNIIVTLTEKMFPVCPVGMVTTAFLRKGSQRIADKSSDPESRRL